APPISARAAAPPGPGEEAGKRLGHPFRLAKPYRGLDEVWDAARRGRGGKTTFPADGLQVDGCWLQPSLAEVEHAERPARPGPGSGGNVAGRLGECGVRQLTTTLLFASNGGQVGRDRVPLIHPLRLRGVLRDRQRLGQHARRVPLVAVEDQRLGLASEHDGQPADSALGPRVGYPFHRAFTRFGAYEREE